MIGGTGTSFTELNRRRPPPASVDGVTHSFTAIVHESSDEAVLSTLKVVSTVVENVKALFPKRDYWLGPSDIGLRGNPFGGPDTAHAAGSRRTMTNADPRQRGCFGAAYTLGLVSRLAGKGISCIGLGDVIGPRGLTHQEAGPEEDQAPLWCQGNYVAERHGTTRAGRVRYYPAFHVIRGIGRARGAVMWDVVTSCPDRVAAVAFHVPPPKEKKQTGNIARVAGTPARRVSSSVEDFASPLRQFEQKRETIGGDLASAIGRQTGFVGELWIANLTAGTQCVTVPLGHKASFAVALLDHTLGTKHADYEPGFLDETLSSAILSTSPDPTKLSLDLEPFAVARIVITPHIVSTDAFLDE